MVSRRTFVKAAAAAPLLAGGLSFAPVGGDGANSQEQRRHDPGSCTYGGDPFSFA